MATRVKNKQASTVVYLYGISKASSKVPAIAGVDGHAAIETIDCGLTCWVSHVPRIEFADNLAKNIENLDWLAEMSTRHQAVVSEIAQGTDLLPARFGVVFASEVSLCADVRGRKRVLQTDLKRIKGNEEWGIKVFALAPKMAKTAVVKSGRDYLQAKSALMKARQPAHSGDELRPFVDALEELAIDVAEGGRISSGRRDLQYHVSLLLPRSQRLKLEKILGRFTSEWEGKWKIECTGPWPPYSFVSRLSE